MTIKNPIQYTSRTFNTILNDINSDSELVDKPNWFKRIWAGIGDVISMWINALGNNLVLRTAYTRQNVIDLLELIDYDLNAQTTSSGEILFYINKSAVFPFTVSAIDLKSKTPGSLNVSSKTFEARTPSTLETIDLLGVVISVNSTTDIMTISGREYFTGEKLIFQDLTVPDPLSPGIEYWIIRVSSTEIRVSESVEDAYSGIYIDLLSIGSGPIIPFKSYSFFKTVYQQESKENIIIGQSDGVTEFQDFSLVEQNILEDTIVIEINSELYEKVDTLVFSESIDKHYEVVYTTDNVAIIRFGNNIYGEIPPAFDINATFSVGGGSDSNVNVINSINIYAGADQNIVGTSNPSKLSGGDNIEDIETGKRLGPLLLKTRDRFITSEDGESLAEEFGGISQVVVNGNEFGILSAEVVIIPDGGGTTSSQFKSDLQEYLIDRTVLESIDVRVVDGTYLTQNVISNVKVLSGYSLSDILTYIELGYKLLFSETGLEIYRDFISNGISSTTELINNIFSTSYSASDYNQIQRLVENLSPRIIGIGVQESDIIGYIDIFVNGVDYLTISSPSFPISINKNEITTIGTISIVEII